MPGLYSCVQAAERDVRNCAKPLSNNTTLMKRTERGGSEVAALTYKDAVEGSVIKQRRLVQFQSVRLVTARLQDLIAGARTEREQLSHRNAVRRRHHNAQNARADEPSLPLPTHLIAF